MGTDPDVLTSGGCEMNGPTLWLTDRGHVHQSKQEAWEWSDGRIEPIYRESEHRLACERAYQSGFSDGRNGTPCEAIRMQQRIEELEEMVCKALPYVSDVAHDDTLAQKLEEQLKRGMAADGGVAMTLGQQVEQTAVDLDLLIKESTVDGVLDWAKLFHLVDRVFEKSVK